MPRIPLANFMFNFFVAVKLKFGFELHFKILGKIWYYIRYLYGNGVLCTMRNEPHLTTWQRELMQILSLILDFCVRCW